MLKLKDHLCKVSYKKNGKTKSGIVFSIEP